MKTLNSSSKGIILQLVYLVVMVVFYFFLWEGAPYNNIDTGDYTSYAQGWLKDGFKLYPGRTFGYPLLIWLCNFFGGYKTLYLLQLVFHFTGVLLLCKLGRNFGLGKSAVYIFAAVAALPLFVAPATQILTESAAQFWLIAALFSMFIGVNKKNNTAFFLASVFIFLAAITRPAYQAIIYPLGLILIYFMLMNKWQKISIAIKLLLFFLPFITGFLLYSQYNKVNYGFSGLTPNLAYNLSTRTHGVVEQIPAKHGVIKEILVESYDSALLLKLMHSKEMYIWSAITKLEAWSGKPFYAIAPEIMQINKQLILNNPIYYLRNVLQSAVNYFFPVFAPGTGKYKIIQFAYLAAHFTFIAMFFLATVFYIYRFLRLLMNRQISRQFTQRQLLLVLLFLFVSYTLVVSCMFDVGLPRYRQPTDLFILLIISFCFSYVYKARKNSISV